MSIRDTPESPGGSERNEVAIALIIRLVIVLLLPSACATPAGQGASSGSDESTYRADDGPVDSRAEDRVGSWAGNFELAQGTLGASLGSGEPVYPLITSATGYQPGNYEALRPRVMGRHGIVASGHHLATQAGYEILRAGGNAFDAGVATAMAVKALKMDYAGWVGVGPLIFYSASEDRVLTRIGTGTSPALATLDHFLEHGKTPLNRALVPADIDVWLAALERYGTMSFERVAGATLEIVEEGYPLYKMQQYMILSSEERIRRYPYNVSFFLQNEDRGHRIGSLMTNPDLGRTIRYMIDAEKEALANGGLREHAIRAARDAFYKGEPARAVDRYFRKEGGLMRYEDLAEYEGKWMAPLHTNYRGYDVYTPDGWSQAPRMILVLNILENFDLRSLGYMSSEYIHIVSQAIELAISDSHRWVGDPDHVEIPKVLWSKEYGKLRAGLIDRDRAFADMPPWGDPVRMRAVAPESPRSFVEPMRLSDPQALEEDGDQDEIDTTSASVIDAEGNLFSITVSDPQTGVPMIPGWGFGLGGRGGQFNLNPELANVVAPGKRPRNTNAPVLVMKDGEPFMGLSTPGGDQQVQILLQVLLNVIEWQMPIEHAVDQPRFGSYNFPGTGGEVNREPGVLRIEARILKEVVDALEEMGHDVRSWGEWNYRTGSPTVTYRDPETGLLVGAADVRREGAALGY